MMKTEDEKQELLLSAQINFENFEKMNPLVKSNPIYMIAKKQLDEALEDSE